MWHKSRAEQRLGRANCDAVLRPKIPRSGPNHQFEFLYGHGHFLLRFPEWLHRNTIRTTQTHKQTNTNLNLPRFSCQSRHLFISESIAIYLYVTCPLTFLCLRYYVCYPWVHEYYIILYCLWLDCLAFSLSLSLFVYLSLLNSDSWVRAYVLHKCLKGSCLNLSYCCWHQAKLQSCCASLRADQMEIEMWTVESE